MECTQWAEVNVGLHPPPACRQLTQPCRPARLPGQRSLQWVVDADDTGRSEGENLACQGTGRRGHIRSGQSLEGQLAGRQGRKRC